MSMNLSQLLVKRGCLEPPSSLLTLLLWGNSVSTYVVSTNVAGRGMTIYPCPSIRLHGVLLNEVQDHFYFPSLTLVNEEAYKLSKDLKDRHSL
jgi:hypothetical protein